MSLTGQTNTALGYITAVDLAGVESSLRVTLNTKANTSNPTPYAPKIKTNEREDKLKYRDRAIQNIKNNKNKKPWWDNAMTKAAT